MMTTIAATVCGPILGNVPGVAKTYPDIFGMLGQGWVQLTLLALLASLFALAVIFIIANFLRNQQLLAWSKFELFQIFGTATILIYCMVWITGMCTFKMDFLNDPSASIDYTGKNMFDIIDGYFSYMENFGSYVFGQLMYASKVITLLQKVTYFSSPLGLGMNDNPLDSLGQLNSVIFFMVSGFVTSYLLLGLQMRMMEYMAIAILYYLLPFGLFFRAFEPTRAFGGTLIGLSIAFFLFYPIAIVFNDFIMRAQLTELQKAMQKAEEKQAEAVKNGEVPNDEELKEAIKQFGDQNTWKGKLNSMATGASSEIFFLLQATVFYVMGAVILPVLNFVVVVEMAKALTKVMGEELDVSNLTRLI